MSRRTRFILKFIAILLVLIAVLLDFGTLNIPALVPYKFWMSVLGFGILLVSSR